MDIGNEVEGCGAWLRVPNGVLRGPTTHDKMSGPYTRCAEMVEPSRTLAGVPEALGGSPAGLSGSDDGV